MRGLVVHYALNKLLPPDLVSLIVPLLGPSIEYTTIISYTYDLPFP